MKAALLIVVLPVLLVSAFGANAQRIIDTRPICKGGLFEKVQNLLSPGCQTQDEYDAQMQAERNFARWCANTQRPAETSCRGEDVQPQKMNARRCRETQPLFVVALARSGVKRLRVALRISHASVKFDDAAQ